MKKYYYIIILIFFTSISANSQVIENKLNLNLSSGICNVNGEISIIEDNYITPSLYSNYSFVYNYNAKMIIHAYSYISYGIKINSISFNNWNNIITDTLFNLSNTKNFVFAPTIQIHNRFKEKGFFNRVKVYIEVSPSIGKSTLRLNTPVFYVQSGSGTEQSPLLETKDFILGVEAGGGIELALSNGFGIFSNFSYTYNKVNSAFYNDKHFSYTSLNFGFFVRLLINKHFYY